MTIELRRSVVALALVASFMVFVDGTIVNLALAPLSTHLGASRSELEWVVNAYTLAFASVMLGAGAITDALGAKRAFVAGLVVFTVSSLGCASAGTIWYLIAARAVQGVGAALLLPSAVVLATAGAVDDSSRAKLVGWWAAAGGAGMAAGPLLGGVLVAFTDWRAIFAVNVIVGVPAIVWALRAAPLVAARKHALAVPGLVSATLFICALVFSLVEAPVLGWSSGAVMWAVVMAVLAATIFAGIERATSTPVLPRRLYVERRFTTVVAQGALFNFTFYGVLFALGLLLQQGLGLSALRSGALFLPLTGLISVGSLCAAPLGRRHRHGVLVAVGLAVTILSLAAAAWAVTFGAPWPLALAFAPAGLCAGVLVPMLTAQALRAVGPALHGAAAAAFNTSRQVGGAVGVAAFGPLLGQAHDLTKGFRTCMALAASATAVSLGLNWLGSGATRWRGGVKTESP